MSEMYGRTNRKELEKNQSTKVYDTSVIKEVQETIFCFWLKQ